jgi:NAD(P)-dependent dehydrogenase (short-subunit alcohol dehydrogenase family)
VKAVVSRFERIDLLWNNAGYQGMIKPTLDYDPDDFAKVLNINVTGLSRVPCCQELLLAVGGVPRRTFA